MHDKRAVAFQALHIQLKELVLGAKVHRAAAHLQGLDIAVAHQHPVGRVVHTQLGDVFQLAGQPGAVVELNLGGAAVFDHHIADQEAAVNVHIGGGVAGDLQEVAVAAGEGRAVAYLDIRVCPGARQNGCAVFAFDAGTVQYQHAVYDSGRSVESHLYAIGTADDPTVVGKSLPAQQRYTDAIIVGRLDKGAGEVQHTVGTGTGATVGTGDRTVDHRHAGPIGCTQVAPGGQTSAALMGDRAVADEHITASHTQSGVCAAACSDIRALNANPRVVGDDVLGRAAWRDDQGCGLGANVAGGRSFDRQAGTGQ